MANTMADSLLNAKKNCATSTNACSILQLKAVLWPENTKKFKALTGQSTQGYDNGLFSFVRWSDNQKVVVVTFNFDTNQTSKFELQIPADIIQSWKLDKWHV